MASSSHHQPFSSKRPNTGFLPPPLPPLPQPSVPLKNTTPNPASSAVADIADDDKGKALISPSEEYVVLTNSSYLTAQEVMRRRSHNLKELAKVYTDHYWKLMEDLRVEHRDYVWKFGLNPFQEGNKNDEKESKEINADGGGGGICEGSGETNVYNNGNYGGNQLCAFNGCKLKAMALTTYCKLHILSDKKQQLYKPCDYVIKSALAGAITCGKPILRSTVPSLCNTHTQKAQNHLNRALRKTGLNVSSTDVVTPKLHVLVAEYVREIQSKRKAAKKANRKKGLAKNESGS